MRKTLILLLAIFALYSCSKDYVSSVDENGIQYLYFADNGKSVIANDNAIIGETYILNDKEYLVVDRDMLDSLIENDDDVSHCVTTNVTDMSGLFYREYNFNQDKYNFNQDIGSWDVSNVTDMSWMFCSDTTFNQNIKYWDVSNVRNMEGMFYDATAFNQNIGSWDVSYVTNMSYMFYDATNFDQDLSNWCVSYFFRCPSYFSTGSALTTAHLPIWGYICT